MAPGTAGDAAFTPSLQQALAVFLHELNMDRDLNHGRSAPAVPRVCRNQVNSIESKKDKEASILN